LTLAVLLGVLGLSKKTTEIFTSGSTHADKLEV